MPDRPHHSPDAGTPDTAQRSCSAIEAMLADRANGRPPLSIDPLLAKRAKADTLTPQQQMTPIREKISQDFRERQMLKYPGLAQFRNRAEYLFAGLLEAAPEILSYIPHPFRLRIGKQLYTPAFFVVRDGYRVISIHRKDELTPAIRDPLSHYLALHRMDFTVIAEQAIKDHCIEAENWLEIVRVLYLARDLHTGAEEQALLARLQRDERYPLDELVDPGDRQGTYPTEIAIFRLLHRGLLQASLNTGSLDYGTEIWRCV